MKGGGKFWLLRQILHFVLAMLIARKVYLGFQTMNYAKSCAKELSIESFLEDQNFKDLVKDLNKSAHEPAFMFMNKYAVNITFNWLCNTESMPGVHERMVFVTLDQESRDIMRQFWPKLRVFYRPTDCLKIHFSFGESAYQTFFALRSNFASALAQLGQGFWMMQQDTVWRDNLFQVQWERKKAEYDIIFDQLGYERSAREKWINGANFFVRPSPAVAQFFATIGQTLVDWYVPDVAVMINQCAANKVQCGYFPYSLVSCWEWMYNGRQEKPPYLMQMDAEDSQGGKLKNMQKIGFYFLNQDSRTCNRSAVERGRENLRQSNVDLTPRRSLSRAQFTVYWIFAEIILRVPILGELIRPYLPLLCYYLLITL